jgi:sec-independent protein translocase protein TatB
MFGMGMGELIVIVIVALLFLGPEKLPDAAKSISKGIRDFRKQTRELQQSLEDDEEIGGAIRDLKSALRGDELPPRTQHAKARAPQRVAEAERQIEAPGGEGVAKEAVTEAGAGAAPTTPEAAPDDMPVIRPPSGVVTRSAAPGAAGPSGELGAGEHQSPGSAGESPDDEKNEAGREEAHG